MEKLNIAVGYSSIIYNELEFLKKKVNSLELYLSYDQWKNNTVSYDNINLLFNIVPDKVNFLRGWKENLQKVKEVNPNYITTSVFTFGKILAEEGYNVDASIINNISTIEDVHELDKLGYKGFTLASHKIYDFSLMKEIKKYFPHLRMKIIPNMMCPLCILYTEKHECFYFNDTTHDLIGTRAEYVCDKNPLKTSIVWPDLLRNYSHIDVLKFASRKEDPMVLEMIMAFLDNRNKDYINVMLDFFVRKNNLHDFFIENKQLCNFKCYKCKMDCDKKYTDYLINEENNLSGR